MRHPLRLLLAAAALLTVAGPAAGAEPRARTAAERHAEAVLADAGALREGTGVRTGRELSEALRELAINFRHLRGDERAEARALLSRPTDALDDDAYEPGAPVERKCLGQFCVHYTTSGTDIAALAFVDAVLAEAQVVRAFENGTLGWRVPPSDGDNRLDIYLKDVGSDGLFGYAATDPGQVTQAQHSYLVLDNDFDPSQYNDVPAPDSMRVTLAHEYGHVLQYGYDVLADGWHYESSATWLEGALYPELDDWLRYLADSPAGPPGWRSLTEVPLTAYSFGADSESADPRNAKPYGTVVWNQFLASRYGNDLQRRTWELSDGLEAPSTRAYDSAIKSAAGGGFASEFAAFSAGVAEWRTPDSGFPRTAGLPDVERVGALRTDAATITPAMDHLTFGLYDVPPTSAPRIRLTASFPQGMHGSLALVGREGTANAGKVSVQLAQLPNGGVGGVTLDDPSRFTASGGRVTAVLVNADAGQVGWGDLLGDWIWSRDGQRVAAAVTSDLSGPAISDRAPAANVTGVRLRRSVRVTFSKPVSGVDTQSFSLRRPNGRRVPASVSYARNTRTAVLVPERPLSDTTRYSVRLTDAIVDAAATPLAATDWSFTTIRRGPRARVKPLTARTGAVRVRLRSKDRDRLRWSAKIVANGRKVAVKRGRLRPRATRTLKLAAGRRARGRLVIVLRDPQGNRKRIVRSVRVGPRS